MHSFLMFIKYVCFCVRVHASVENELAVKKGKKKKEKEAHRGTEEREETRGDERERKRKKRGGHTVNI